MPYLKLPNASERAILTATERAAGIAGVLLLAAYTGVSARGVSPYLPLNLEPEMEAQIERVLILADKPVMRRPIAAATVLDALPAACKVDQALCERVGRFLERYTHEAGLTHASVEGAATHGSDPILPDSYGLPNRSSWDASASGYVQPSDYVLVSAGAVAYEGRVDYTGSMLSLGWSKAQLDIGYKPHWLSPFTDSSMLLSTEAPTMPSVTVSNYEPLTRLGISYEIFGARMSESHRIVWQDGYTSGHPNLGGFQLALEPASGWSVGFNRLVQFGGGARGGSSPGDVLRAIFNPSSNQTPASNADQKATNQEGSVTSSLIIPGRVPFIVYIEYAGEDTSRGKNYLLGNSSLSWGIHFPRLAQRFDLTLETSEWQNGWYTHYIWLDGMTNDGLVVSNWFGDQRVFGDGVGGRSAMARLIWDATFGGQVELRYRTLENQVYGEVPYKHYHEATLGYSRPWKGLIIGGEVDAGRDVFGNDFGRVSGFLRYNNPATSYSQAQLDGTYDDRERTQLFVDAGVSSLKERVDLTGTVPKTTAPAAQNAHFALGARREVSGHSDLGTRVEFDELSGHSLIGVRLIDYRYRFANPLALGVFLGAARYSLATPAYGFYYGVGLEWRNLLPHLDAGLDARYYDSVARDHLLPSDPQSTRPDSFYDIFGAVLSLTYHF